MCALNSLTTKDGSIIEVASIKREAIENIIVSAAVCPSIDAVVLFGSALEERCNKDSDIDIAIISTKSINSLSKLKSFQEFLNRIYLFDMSQEYDRLYYKSLEYIGKNASHVQICGEIAKKGKIIYRKEVA